MPGPASTWPTGTMRTIVIPRPAAQPPVSPATTPRRPYRTALFLAAGAVGLALCLTVLFLAMRSVIEVGGACASGGPYQVARPCPKGVGAAVPLSIVGGLVSVGFLVAGTFPRGGPRLAAFAWPALFCSLGWNFLDFAFDPPGDAPGPVWGWLICGIVFVLMGLAPLLAVVGEARTLLWGPPPPDQANDLTFDARPSGRLFLLALSAGSLALGVVAGLRLFGAVS